MIQEEDGTVDIEPLLGKMTDNLIVAATKEYPDLFGGITIGNGKIKIGVPGIDKDIVLEAADIDHFKKLFKISFFHEITKTVIVDLIVNGNML